MSAEWIAADSDSEAIEHVRGQVDGTRFELWEHKRLVDRSDQKDRT